MNISEADFARCSESHDGAGTVRFGARISRIPEAGNRAPWRARPRFAVDGLTAASIIRPVAGAKPWTLMGGQSGTVRSICLHSLATRERAAGFLEYFIERDISHMQLTVKSGSIDELAQVDSPYNAIGFAHAGACLDRPLPDCRAGNAIRCNRDPTNVRAMRRRPRLQSPAGRRIAFRCPAARPSASSTGLSPPLA